MTCRWNLTASRAASAAPDFVVVFVVVAPAPASVTETETDDDATDANGSWHQHLWRQPSHRPNNKTTEETLIPNNNFS